MRELYGGLDKIGEREQAYLLYRYGFVDDVEHTMIGTAIHFNRSESRAKKTEELAMDNLWLELPWWYERHRTFLLSAIIEALLAIEKLIEESASGK